MHFPYSIKRFSTAVVLIFCTAFTHLAFDASGQGGNDEVAWVADSTREAQGLNRFTPRSSVKGFLDAVARDRYDVAVEYIDLTGVEAEDSTAVARMVEAAFTRGDLYTLARISDDPEGSGRDDLQAGVDVVGTLSTDEGKVDILLKRVDRDVPVWLISGETVRRAVDAGGEALLIDRILPRRLQGSDWFGAPPVQWLAALILVVVAFAVARALVYLTSRALPMVWPAARKNPVSGVIRAFSLPVALYVAVWFFVFMSRELGLSIVLRQKLSLLTGLMGVTALLVLLWKLSQFAAAYTQDRMVSNGNLTGVSIVVFLRKAAKTAIVVIGILLFLSLLGVDVTAGLAALGIGGIALALGAQKTVENFVGGLMLITDRPVRVGDFCLVGDISGTVESIGMRSTRIRTNDRTVVTIPNGQFSSEKIENFAHRDRFWFHPTFGLHRATTPDQVRLVIVELQSLLYAHKLVENSSARVRLAALHQERIDIEVFSYIVTPTFDEYLEVQEDLLLRIMDLFERRGIRMAHPVKRVFVSQDEEPNAEKVSEAGTIVAAWRENNEMPLPNFPQDKIDALRNTIGFPPEGSSSGK